MMKSYVYKVALFAVLLFGNIGCKKDQVSRTKEEDQQELVVLRNEIEKFSTQFNCDNAVDWKFIAVGTKACGGPTGYLAYSNKIDETLFLKNVALYTEKEKAFNLKWDIASDCMFTVPPKSVACVSGKPKFVY